MYFADNTNYDANHPNRDRLFKIREVCQMINDRCSAVYYPCEDLSVDEFLVLFKRRLFFKQYIRTKRSSFGIKVYGLCTNNRIMLGFTISHGNIEDGLIKPHGNNWLQTDKIPITLIEPYLEWGHTVYLDNFYTTPRLAKYLLDHPTKMVGIVRPNRKIVLPGIRGKDLEKSKAAFYVSGNVLAVRDRASKTIQNVNSRQHVFYQLAMLLRWKTQI